MSKALLKLVPEPPIGNIQTSTNGSSSTAIEAVSKPPTEKKESPRCKVCNQDYDGGLHYGVRACCCCKAFFRRSIHQNMEYECLKGGDCAIDGELRVTCRACRLRKCFAVGMKAEAVRPMRGKINRVKKRGRKWSTWKDTVAANKDSQGSSRQRTEGKDATKASAFIPTSFEMDASRFPTATEPASQKHQTGSAAVEQSPASRLPGSSACNLDLRQVFALLSGPPIQWSTTSGHILNKRY